jgi:hypothetical protein
MKRFTCQKKFGISADKIPEIIVQEKILREQLEGKMQKLTLELRAKGRKPRYNSQELKNMVMSRLLIQ